MKDRMAFLNLVDPFRVKLMRARYERLISAIAAKVSVEPFDFDKKDWDWMAKAVELALKIRAWLIIYDNN